MYPGATEQDGAGGRVATALPVRIGGRPLPTAPRLGGCPLQLCVQQITTHSAGACRETTVCADDGALPDSAHLSEAQASVAPAALILGACLPLFIYIFHLLSEVRVDALNLSLSLLGHWQLRHYLIL